MPKDAVFECSEICLLVIIELLPESNQEVSQKMTDKHATEH